MFPIDEETITYLRADRPLRGAGRAGRGLRQGAGPLARRRPRAALLRVPRARPATVVPSIAGPKRPQDRVAITDAKEAFREALPTTRARGDDEPDAAADSSGSSVDEASEETFPASRPGQPGRARQRRRRQAAHRRRRHGRRAAPSKPTRVTMEDGTETEIDHGARRHRRDHLVHQHLQPAGDDRRRAAGQERRRAGPDHASRGSRRRWRPGPRSSWTTTRRPGSRPYLDKLGFNLVGYGCTTCIGNSGPLPEPVSARRSTRPTSPSSRCCRATATSRAGSTPTSR